MSDPPVVRVKRVVDQNYEVTRIAEPVMHYNDDVVDVNYEIFAVDKTTKLQESIRERHSMRYFFRPEMEELLWSAGFEVAEVLDCKTLNTPDLSSWTVYFICKAV